MIRHLARLRHHLLCFATGWSLRLRPQPLGTPRPVREIPHEIPGMGPREKWPAWFCRMEPDQQGLWVAWITGARDLVEEDYDRMVQGFGYVGVVHLNNALVILPLIVVYTLLLLFGWTPVGLAFGLLIILIAGYTDSRAALLKWRAKRELRAASA